MILLSLLLALALERVVDKPRLWQARTYMGMYVRGFSQYLGKDEKSSLGMVWVWIALPALLTALVIWLLPGIFLEFLFSLAVLFVCLGCPEERQEYRQYLQAVNRGDTEACCLHADQMGHDENRGMSFGQTLMWINYRHYAAVILWFAACGATGAVLYVVARNLLQIFEHIEHPYTRQCHDIVKILDWIPVRIVALGYVLMGNFSRAFPVWLGYFGDTKTSALTLLCAVGRAAEDHVSPEDTSVEPVTMLQLAKRTMLFLLVFISILTISGLLG